MKSTENSMLVDCFANMHPHNSDNNFFLTYTRQTALLFPLVFLYNDIQAFMSVSAEKYW